VFIVEKQGKSESAGAGQASAKMFAQNGNPLCSPQPDLLKKMGSGNQFYAIDLVICKLTTYYLCVVVVQQLALCFVEK
jgi:hypothetical protein